MFFSVIREMKEEEGRKGKPEKQKQEEGESRLEERPKRVL